MKLSSAEAELKLALAPSVAESVLSVPVLKQSRADRPKSQRLVTTYYETPEKDRATSRPLSRATHRQLLSIIWSCLTAAAESRGNVVLFYGLFHMTDCCDEGIRTAMLFAIASV
jgi:hypothetical protein